MWVSQGDVRQPHDGEILRWKRRAGQSHLCRGTSPGSPLPSALGLVVPGGQLPTSLGVWRAGGWRLKAWGLAFLHRRGEQSSAREERWGGGAQALPCRGMGARQEKSYSPARSGSWKRIGLRALPGSPLASREGKKNSFFITFFFFFTYSFTLTQKHLTIFFLHI